jgi:archaellum component FlaG (FlaF/FlaG flagellin family)
MIMGIAAIIILSSLIAAIFPQVFSVAASIKGTTGDASERAATSATVINYDAPGPGRLQFDVLNSGRSSLPSSAINMSAVYLGNETVPSTLLKLDGQPGEHSWTYVICGAGDGVWGPGDTLTITAANPGYSYAPGAYRLKIVLGNGAICQHTFRING